MEKIVFKYIVSSAVIGLLTFLCGCSSQNNSSPDDATLTSTTEDMTTTSNQDNSTDAVEATNSSKITMSGLEGTWEQNDNAQCEIVIIGERVYFTVFSDEKKAKIDSQADYKIRSEGRNKELFLYNADISKGEEAVFSIVLSSADTDSRGVTLYSLDTPDDKYSFHYLSASGFVPLFSKEPYIGMYVTDLAISTWGNPTDIDRGDSNTAAYMEAWHYENGTIYLMNNEVYFISKE